MAVLLSHHLKDDVPHPVSGVTFHESQILPGTDGDLAVDKGDRDEGRKKQGMDMRRSVIVVQGIMVTVMDHLSVLVSVGGNSLHGLPDIMPDQTGLKLESCQRRNTSCRKPGDDPAADLLLSSCFADRFPKIICDIDHSHIAFCLIGFCHCVDCHRIPPVCFEAFFEMLSAGPMPEIRMI